MGKHLPSLAETDGDPDYFVDMIEQLAERAREIGEFEVALHLDATAKARRHELDNSAVTKLRLHVRA